MFKIGEFSKFTQVSIRMLRYYDEIGLFNPIEVDELTGYRYYSAKQITKLNKIVTLRDMGFVIAEIIEVMNCKTDDEILEILKRKHKVIKQTLEKENLKLEKVNIMMGSLGKETFKMNYEVNLKEVPAYKVASLRDTIAAYNREGELWGRLGAFMERNKIPCSGIAFAIYHDGEYKEKDVDVEVVACTDKILEDKEGITFREVESVPCMASIMVPGDFSNIAPAYNSLANWIEESDYQTCGLARQVTHKGPWCEDNPENYLTEIQIPVKKI